MYDELLSQYTEALKAARTKQYLSIISEGAGNHKKIVKTINRILAPSHQFVPLCRSVTSFLVSLLKKKMKSYTICKFGPLRFLRPIQLPQLSHSHY